MLLRVGGARQSGGKSYLILSLPSRQPRTLEEDRHTYNSSELVSMFESAMEYVGHVHQKLIAQPSIVPSLRHVLPGFETRSVARSSLKVIFGLHR